MKIAVKCLFLLLFSGMLFAQSSSPFPSQIKNVVVIFQENRTQDNLFQALPSHGTSGITGCYDISSVYPNPNPTATPLPLQPVGLATNFDLSHSHSNFEFELNNPGVPVYA